MPSGLFTGNLAGNLEQQQSLKSALDMARKTHAKLNSFFIKFTVPNKKVSFLESEKKHK